MKRISATPDDISHFVAMREAGYSVLSISQKTGISARTLQRHFAMHGTKKGSIKQELLDSTRAEMLRYITSNDAIREEAAKLIHDDLAHARHLREIIFQASEHLQATSLTDAALVMRAAAAYSTAIKNTSDMLRHNLKLDDADKASAELPALVIQELSCADIVALRNKPLEETSAVDMLS